VLANLDIYSDKVRTDFAHKALAPYGETPPKD